MPSTKAKARGWWRRGRRGSKVSSEERAKALLKILRMKVFKALTLEDRAIVVRQLYEEYYESPVSVDRRRAEPTAPFAPDGGHWYGYRERRRKALQRDQELRDRVKAR